MQVAVPLETGARERRVAATPEAVRELVCRGFSVAVQAGAGRAATFRDADYEAAGAAIVDDVRALWSSADLVLKVAPPTERPDLGVHEADLLKPGATLVSFLWPDLDGALVERLAARGVTAFAVDKIPRTSRAQTMDALSSMANIAGYRAVIEAAHRFGSFFTQQITAAGKLPPAKVLIIGAGVAGLSAIATARGLGAIVRAFDTRPSVKDQVKSLGAEFLELEFDEDGEGQGGYAKVMSQAFIDAEMALFREQAKDVDIVVTTALIPGKKAPTLWTRDMVEAMRPGSVVVDLAASQGGNCELTRADEEVDHQGVTIWGPTDLPSRLATTASQLYSRNLLHFLKELGDGSGLSVDHDNVEVRGALALEGGETRWPPPKLADPSPKAPPKPAEPKPEAAAPAPAPASAPAPGPEPAEIKAPPVVSPLAAFVSLALLGVWIGLKLHFRGDGTPAPEVALFLQHLTVFVLAVFVGWQVIWNVTAALHTPLMSVTNAISGIIILGGLLQTSGELDLTSALGLLAVFLAMINVAGGFLVTQRMLRMFRR